MKPVTLQEVLKKLADWSEGCPDEVCKSIWPEICRHRRAAWAIIEVRNAVADIESRGP